mgnify:CR=1 FL=1
MKKTSKDTILQEYKVSTPSELLLFLVEKNVRKSRNAIKSLLAHKQIRVNGKLITQFDFKLDAGDVVLVMKFDQSRKEKKLKGATIVFEDEYIIVIDKDAGLLSVSTDKEKSKTAFSILNEYVRKSNKNARVFVLHRLDREMSGLMVFAKDQDTQALFQSAWDKIVKEYNFSAVVEGEVKSKEGIVKSWLTENRNLVMQYSLTDNGGLEAETHYRLVKSANRYSLLDLKLETRRKNQARIHMKQIGHPIVGDKKYGAKNNPIKRIALHAQSMVVIHPITKETIEMKSPVPRKMLDLLNQTDPKLTNKNI